jgi:hypothetical protein
MNDVQPPAPSFLKDLGQAVHMGRGFEFRHGYGEIDGQLNELPKSHRQQLLNLARGNLAARPAVYAAFYQGLCQRIGKTPLPLGMGMRWQVMVQHCLTKTFLWLPEASREQIIRSGSALGLDPGPWIGICYGAMAVARTAYVALGFSKAVFLPRVSEDGFGKIDLIVSFPSIKQGLCLQIKNSNAENITRHRSVEDDWWTRIDHADQYRRQVMQGLEDFSSKNRGVWRAISVDVGSLGVPAAALESCESIQRPLIEMLMQNVPGLAAAVRKHS